MFVCACVTGQFSWSPSQSSSSMYNGSSSSSTGQQGEAPPPLAPPRSTSVRHPVNRMSGSSFDSRDGSPSSLSRVSNQTCEQEFFCWYVRGLFVCLLVVVVVVFAVLFFISHLFTNLSVFIDQLHDFLIIEGIVTRFLVTIDMGC